MKMTPDVMERGIQTSIDFLDIMSRVILREEEEIASGQSQPIEYLDSLKKQVEDQYWATLALKELMERQLPRMKAEAAAETVPQKAQRQIKNKNTAQSQVTADEINILKENISLF